MRLDEDGELIVGTSVLGDTYNPLVTGVTSDALVAGRHSYIRFFRYLEN